MALLWLPSWAGGPIFLRERFFSACKCRRFATVLPVFFRSFRPGRAVSLLVAHSVGHFGLVWSLVSASRRSGFAGNTGGNMVGPSNRANHCHIGPRFGFPVWFNVPMSILSVLTPTRRTPGKRPPRDRTVPGSLSSNIIFIAVQLYRLTGASDRLRDYFTIAGASPHLTIPGQPLRGLTLIPRHNGTLMYSPGPCPAYGPGAVK